MHEGLVEYLKEKNSAACSLEKGDAGNTILVLGQAEKIQEVSQVLKEHPDYEFNVLQVIAGVDYPEANEMHVNYVLASFTKHQELILKVKLPRENPEIATVSSVWKAADWQERECYDMLGVIFKGHPDHRRILCPDDWEGFPLRRDYQAAEKYRHMDVYPEAKMNLADREFAEKQKQAEKAAKEAAKTQAAKEE